MPADNPPPGVRPQPRYTDLPAGSFLWRVTRRPVGGGPVSPFLTVPDADTYDARLGGRFDPTPDCPYPYCYAAFDDLTALCEVLLRDVGFDGPQRYLLKRDIAGRRLAILETTRPLWLISLQDAADLAAACQDSWLIHTETRELPHHPPVGALAARQRNTGREGSGGLVWLSKRAPNGRAVLLFGDRCDDAVVFSPFGERCLDEAGLDWLNLRLAQLRTKVRS